MCQRKERAEFNLRDKCLYGHGRCGWDGEEKNSLPLQLIVTCIAYSLYRLRYLGSVFKRNKPETQYKYYISASYGTGLRFNLRV
jgi:hypothetical protein